MRADVRYRNVFVGLGFGALALLGGAGQAAAQTPNCNDTTMFPNPIYLAGSSAFEPTASQIAVKLATQATPYTLIYKGTASCDGPAAIRDNVTLTGNGDHFVLAADGVAVMTQQCVLDPAGVTTKADVGVTDVYYPACNGGSALPAGLGDFTGPVQAMQFIVPESNTTVTAISAEQAQDIWGCGMTGGISPFTDETAIMQRNMTSGTQIMVSKYVGVPADMFKGVTNGTGGNLVTSLMAASAQGAAIGFLASDAYDTRRAILNALAFKGFGQKKAYYADSGPSVSDKQNVRDGHYIISGPVHFIAPVDTAGAASGKAKLVVDWVQGNTEIVSGLPFGYVDIEGKAGMVPQCAMKVSRDVDGGLLKPYKPKVSCGCYFEKVVTNMSSAACVPCLVDADCTDPTKSCQTNFCEAK